MVKERLILGQILTFVSLIFFLSIMNGSIYLNQESVFSTIPNHVLIIGISFLIIAGLIINGLLVRSLLKLVEKEVEFNAQTAYTESMDELFQSIKAQRHDFNNHVQVLYGMIKENMFDLAKEYITDVFKETRELNDVITVDRPEIASLLKAKHTTALQRNITFKVSISCKLSPITLKPHEIVRVFGNIIDNAFDAVLAVPVVEREVKLTVFLQGGEIYIETLNPGVLPADSNTLFNAGVSTKEGHSGLGLYILKQLVERCNGSIALDNISNGVICRIIFPGENL